MKNIDKYLDSAFSIAVRLNHTDIYGIGYCYTCDKRITFYEAQCGHFVRRKEVLTRWDFDNGKIQCSNCNCDLHGNLIEYESRLVNEKGFDFVHDLKLKGKIDSRESDLDKKKMLQAYRNKIRQLLKSKMFGISGY